MDHAPESHRDLSLSVTSNTNDFSTLPLSFFFFFWFSTLPTTQQVVVLVMSVCFIAFVTMLHAVAKIYQYRSS